MSNAIPSRPRQIHQRHSVAIVTSQYNTEFVEGLTSHAQAELASLLPDSLVQQYKVPGAFEIPLFVQEVAERGGVSAVIALGVLIKGETEHARLVAETVTQALMDISLRCRIPVIHEVLLLENREQAKERCLDEKINRGTEAARIAARIVRSLGELKGRQ